MGASSTVREGALRVWSQAALFDMVGWLGVLSMGSSFDLGCGRDVEMVQSCISNRSRDLV